jgi:hypothetical protein
MTSITPDQDGDITMYATDTTNARPTPQIEYPQPDSPPYQYPLDRRIAFEREEAWLKGYEMGKADMYGQMKWDLLIRGFFGGSLTIGCLILVMILTMGG